MRGNSDIDLTNHADRGDTQTNVDFDAVKVYDLTAMENFHWFQHQNSNKLRMNVL